MPPQDDLLMVVALARLSYDFEQANQELADRAWELAVAMAAEHGLEPTECALALEIDPREVTEGGDESATDDTPGEEADEADLEEDTEPLPG